MTPYTIQRALGKLGAALIQIWLRVFGTRVRKEDVPWLLGPIGPTGEIGDRPYEMVAERVDLRDVEARAVEDVELGDESGVRGAAVSRAMNQLNFPVFGLDLSRGMTSEVLPLRDAGGNVVHTGWYRRVRESGLVIYTGFYTTVQPPGHASPCVKVVFPLPRGNATVILRPGLDERGRFVLVSSGSAFGDPGFYRLLETDDEHLKVKQLRSLHERFTVFTDGDGALRCDHVVRFLGMTILRLHYRMRPQAA